MSDVSGVTPPTPPDELARCKACATVLGLERDRYEQALRAIADETEHPQTVAIAALGDVRRAHAEWVAHVQKNGWEASGA